MTKFPKGPTVTFGAFSRTRPLLDLTTKLNLTPTLEHGRGEEFTTRGGIHNRSEHVWQVQSSQYVRSDDLGDHIRWMLCSIEPFQEALQEYINDPEVDIVIRIDCVCPDSMGGFSISSKTALLIASLSNRLDFGFFGETG